jgi:hypothetical protein
MLPLGGRATGHKGFGLATLTELFAAVVVPSRLSTSVAGEASGTCKPMYSRPFRSTKLIDCTTVGEELGNLWQLSHRQRIHLCVS